jgi:hypothetical protein
MKSSPPRRKTHVKEPPKRPSAQVILFPRYRIKRLPKDIADARARIPQKSA